MDTTKKMNPVKKVSIIIICVIGAAFLFTSPFWLSRFFWKYFDYAFCDHPEDGLIFSNINVTDTSVTMKVTTRGSYLLMSDYDYYIEDDILYIGCKTTHASPKTVFLDINIKLEKPVKKVIAKGSGSEKVLYAGEITDTE